MDLDRDRGIDSHFGIHGLVQNVRRGWQKTRDKFPSVGPESGTNSYSSTQGIHPYPTYIPALREVPPGFRYQPLNAAGNEIRLLKVWRIEPTTAEGARVACTLLHTELALAPTYHALSYRWGDGNSTRKISLDQWSVSITKNLEAALWNLTYWISPLVLWADALCINQNDVEERNLQVGKMRSIYANAMVVDVWIDGDGEYGSAFTLVRDFLQCNGNVWPIKAIFRDPARVEQFESLINFYRHQYWLRIWVVQEIAVAKKVLVHCEGTTIGLPDLVALQQIFSEFQMEIYNLRDLHSQLKSSIVLLYGPDILGIPPKHLPPPNLYEILINQLFKDSTDPRDQVYALIGLTKAKENPTVAPNYSLSTSQVFTNATKYILVECKNLDIIHLQPREDADLNLPSWVPNLALGFKGVMQPLRGYARPDLINQASGSRSACCTVRNNSTLLVRGFVLGIIQHLNSIFPRTQWYELEKTIQQFNSWRTLLSQVKGDERLALCRTLTGGSIEMRAGAIATLLKAFAKLTREHFPQLWDAQLSSFAAYSVEASTWWTSSWVETVSNIICKRNFFISDRGIIGLGPDTLQMGDIICILLGCSLPVILRRVGNDYIYLGEAYVDEYMHGKGIDELEEGMHILEDFTLC